MALPRSLLKLQDRLANLLGCTRDARAPIVRSMLHRSPSEAAGYWLQLIVATGIATMGLVLGSTAVIIGAMLIAPLMVPIVGLGMGLAVGSPFLVLRSISRVLFSVAVVVLVSALLVRGLPFHEVNAEILARVQPTALDLATAAFCAMAGVYATMRSGSDIATTAAGTSIGISLVPPLCVTGFGLGTAASTIASGSALLFVTNFAAIVVVGSLMFALAGFGQVDVNALDDEELARDPDTTFLRRFATRARTLFASSGGPVLRVGMPVVLLAAIYAPLRRGLDEVKWQIDARNSVDAALETMSGRLVQSRVRVERRTVDLQLFLLGNKAEAAEVRASLSERIAREAGVVPRLDVFAVPDASDFESLQRAVTPPTSPAVAAAVEKEKPSAKEVLKEGQEAITRALGTSFPAATAGRPETFAWSLAGETLHIAIWRLGAPLDDAAVEATERALAVDLGMPVVITDVVISSTSIEIRPDTVAVPEAILVARERARSVVGIRLCVIEPAKPDASSPVATATGKRDAGVRRLLETVIADFPRVERHVGAPASVRFVNGACP